MIDKLRSYMIHRKWYIVSALVLLVAELFLMFGPTRWMGEDVETYLFGYQMWIPDVTEENNSFCQVFSPQYRHLTEMGIYLSTSGGVQRKWRLC